MRCTCLGVPQNLSHMSSSAILSSWGSLASSRNGCLVMCLHTHTHTHALLQMDAFPRRFFNKLLLHLFLKLLGSRLLAGPRHFQQWWHNPMVTGYVMCSSWAVSPFQCDSWRDGVRGHFNFWFVACAIQQGITSDWQNLLWSLNPTSTWVRSRRNFDFLEFWISLFLLFSFPLFLPFLRKKPPNFRRQVVCVWPLWRLEWWVERIWYSSSRDSVTKRFCVPFEWFI